jgi:hypothetical protein
MKEDVIQVGSADQSCEPPCHSEPKLYDIDTAMAAMRCRHAWEVQNFVMAHESACLEKIVEEICLAQQVKLIEQDVAALNVEHSGLYDARAKKQLCKEAVAFVETVHREEMLKAEIRIKERSASYNLPLIFFRVACVVCILPVAFVDHEILIQVFGVLFALACGMALVWEDIVGNSLQLVFGATFQRLVSIRVQSLQSTEGIQVTDLSAAAIS